MIRRAWTTADDALLRRHYAYTSAAHLARLLERNQSAEGCETSHARAVAARNSKSAAARNPMIQPNPTQEMTMDTLADQLPAEMQRVQDLLPLYDAIPTGKFAAQMMRQSLDRAARAAAAGDVIAMLAAYQDLQGYSA